VLIQSAAAAPNLDIRSPSFGLEGLAIRAPADPAVEAAVHAVLTELKSNLSTPLAEIKALVKAKNVTEATIKPLLTEIKGDLDSAHAALEAIKAAKPTSTTGPARRQETTPALTTTAPPAATGTPAPDTDDIAVLVQNIVTNLSMTLSSLLSFAKAVPGLGVLLSGIDASLNQVLNGLSNLLAGLLKVVAQLLVGVAKLLSNLAMGLTLGALGL